MENQTTPNLVDNILESFDREVSSFRSLNNVGCNRPQQSDIIPIVKPGQDIIEEGLRDLAAGTETIPSLLVSIGAERLRRLGVPVPEATILSPEHRLYSTLRDIDPDASHSQYNALIRRLVSFERATECGT